MNKNVKQLKNLIFIALLSAIAAVAMQIKIPMDFLMPNLTIDPSTVIVVTGGLLTGTLSILPIAVIKAGIDLMFFTKTGGIGPIADFIVTLAFAFPFVLTYKVVKGKKRAVISSLVGTAAVVIAGILANKYLLLPLYSGKGYIKEEDVNHILLTAMVPLNLIKGIGISILSILLYNALKNIRIFKNDEEAST